MKKIMVLALILLIVSTLSGCFFFKVVKEDSNSLNSSTPSQTEGNAEAVTETQIETQPKTQPETQPQVGKVDSYVEVYKEENLNYTDSVGNSYSAKYRVPKIKLFGDDAEDANEDIQEECLPLIEESFNYAKDGVSLYCTSIDYEAWLNNKYLTVIVTIGNDWGQRFYIVHTLDVLTGDEVDNDDFAKLLNITENQLDIKIKDTMESYYTNNFKGMEKVDIYYTQLEKTTSGENVDDAEVYYGENGQLYLHCTIYSLAGADSYEHLLILN